MSPPLIRLIFDQKVKGQGHSLTWSQSAKTYRRRSSGRRELCTLSSAEPL